MGNSNHDSSIYDTGSHCIRPLRNTLCPIATREILIALVASRIGTPLLDIEKKPCRNREVAATYGLKDVSYDDDTSDKDRKLDSGSHNGVGGRSGRGSTGSR